MLTPHRFPRIALLAAAFAELTVVAYAAFVWFLPLLVDA
jgi:hypothetical protein